MLSFQLKELQSILTFFVELINSLGKVGSLDFTLSTEAQELTAIFFQINFL